MQETEGGFMHCVMIVLQMPRFLDFHPITPKEQQQLAQLKEEFSNVLDDKELLTGRPFVGCPMHFTDLTPGAAFFLHTCDIRILKRKLSKMQTNC